LFPIPDTAGLFVPTTGGYQVIVGMRTSSLTQTVVQSGSGSGSAPTASAVADAVWNKDLSTQTIGAGKDLKDTKNTTKAVLGVSA